MNASIYNILMIVSFALCGVFLIVAIILFFKLRIKSAIDELSGKKSRKQVAEIRKENEANKSRGYVPSIFKDRNDKTTTSLNEGSRRLKRATAQLSREESTAEIDEILDPSGGTVVLSESMNDSGWDEGTSVLGESGDYEGTTLLSEEDEGTTLLSEETIERENIKKCIVIREITVNEADEYIKVE